MAKISHNGEDFMPWSVFRNGKHLAFIDAVREAIGRVVETWHPRAITAHASREGGTFIDVPWKIVLHTTESTGPYGYDPGNYYGHQFWPHATIDTEGIHQHLPIDVAAFALYRGDVQTNNANVVQCEIVWRAGDIENIPDATLANVADWERWVSEQTGAPLEVCPQGFHGDGEGIVLASEFSPIRFSPNDWLAFTGICGHQHVPSGNDHWDPGRFPIERCLGIAGQEDDLKEDERNALLFVGAYLEEVKQGRAELPQVARLSDRLDAIEKRLGTIATGGGTVTVDGVAIAEQVAEKLAARLAQ